MQQLGFLQQGLAGSPRSPVYTSTRVLFSQQARTSQYSQKLNLIVDLKEKCQFCALWRS